MTPNSTINRDNFFVAPLHYDSPKTGRYCEHRPFIILRLFPIQEGYNRILCTTLNLRRRILVIVEVTT